MKELEELIAKYESTIKTCKKFMDTSCTATYCHLQSRIELLEEVIMDLSLMVERKKKQADFLRTDTIGK